MNTKSTGSMFEDGKVNVKSKLALLWVALMFFYIYNDIFSLYQPHHVAEQLRTQSHIDPAGGVRKEVGAHPAQDRLE